MIESLKTSIFPDEWKYSKISQGSKLVPRLSLSSASLAIWRKTLVDVAKSLVNIAVNSLLDVHHWDWPQLSVLERCPAYRELTSHDPRNFKVITLNLCTVLGLLYISLGSVELYIRSQH